MNKTITLNSTQNNYALAENWYGIQVNNKNEFNDLFRKWNYFDSRWASAFAIDGENQIKLLQQFLRITDLEKCEALLKTLYRDLILICEDNRKKLKKIKQTSTFSFFNTKKEISTDKVSSVSTVRVSLPL